MQALGCFVQWASVRRALFDATDRSKYLQELMTGVRKFLDAPQVLLSTIDVLQKIYNL